VAVWLVTGGLVVTVGALAPPDGTNVVVGVVAPGAPGAAGELWAFARFSPLTLRRSSDRLDALVVRALCGALVAPALTAGPASASPASASALARAGMRRLEEVIVASMLVAALATDRRKRSRGVAGARAKHAASG
jgi:hypothetical protein